MTPEQLTDVLRAEAESVSPLPTTVRQSIVAGRRRIARRRVSAAGLAVVALGGTAFLAVETPGSKPSGGERLAIDTNSTASSGSPRVPRLSAGVAGQVRSYATLAELAAESTSVVIAHSVATPVSFAPVPGSPGSAPTAYITVRVSEVLSGTVPAGDVRVVAPGTDLNSGRLGLSEGGPFLLFLQPAVYAANQPAGGYVATGGPAGVFVSPNGNTVSFNRADADSQALPPVVSRTEALALNAGRSEADVIREGR